MILHAITNWKLDQELVYGQIVSHDALGQDSLNPGNWTGVNGGFVQAIARQRPILNFYKKIVFKCYALTFYMISKYESKFFLNQVTIKRKKEKEKISQIITFC